VWAVTEEGKFTTQLSPSYIENAQVHTAAFYQQPGYTTHLSISLLASPPYIELFSSVRCLTARLSICTPSTPPFVGYPSCTASPHHPLQLQPPSSSVDLH
jgi:hypothetical protein